MRMVYALDDVTTEVNATDKCVAQLQAINQKIRFLALNTAIEATQAGPHGSAFNVIARELRELSKETDSTVKNVGNRITSIAGNLRHSHAVLRDIATVDMSSHIFAKDRLDTLLKGMIAQNAAFTAILSETADASAELSTTIAPLVMGLQFQDRTAQQLAHVIQALGVLGEAGDTLRQETFGAMPGTFAQDVVDEAWLARLVEKQTLGDVRKRFLAALLNDQTPDDPVPALATATDPVAGGEIDLF